MYVLSYAAYAMLIYAEEKKDEVFNLVPTIYVQCKVICKCVRVVS